MSGISICVNVSFKFYLLISAMTSSSANFARLTISHRFGLVWDGVQTPERLNKRFSLSICCSNSQDAIKPDGRPLPSKSMMSCKLHEVHEPQSANPSITASHSTLICWLSLWSYTSECWFSIALNLGT